jgi:alpha-beta hydrolase superfamily lysophospholipase
MAAKSMRVLLGLAIAGLLGCAGAWSVGSALTRSTNSAVDAPALPAREVKIASSAGIELAGSFWPARKPGAPAVLLMHGNGSNRGSMTELAGWLNAQGYAVLAVDLRGHGESSPAGKSFGLNEADDVHAALAWLREANPGTPVGAIGFSLGGAASLLGPQGPLPVDALVLEGVYPDIRHAIFNRLAVRLGKWPAVLVEPMLSYQSLPRFGVWPDAISPIRALSRVRAPVMIVGGGDDANTPPSETRAMFNAVQGPRELRILAGVSHNDLGRSMPPGFKDALLAFLDRNLNVPRPANLT